MSKYQTKAGIECTPEECNLIDSLKCLAKKWKKDGKRLWLYSASGLEGQFSDSDKKTAENFGIDYMDVSEFVNVYGKGV